MLRSFRLAAALAISVGLGGCGTVQAILSTDFAKLKQVYEIATTATVPEATAQVAVSSFQVIEAASTEYFKFCAGTPESPKCAPGTTANPGPLRLAIKYMRQGRGARDQIKVAAKAGTPILSTAYNLLIGAVNNLGTTPVPSFGASQ